MQLAMGLKVKDIPELKRTEEEAEELIESVEMVFGKQEKVKDMPSIPLIQLSDSLI